ncbi:unnamed protein product [Acanthoscelides obtectus]|uniref:Uncharacterized protein n=1 Tax=Acanthoscelides obtectus TaxID=200917 RepID=A0A9P0PXR8_ACAOB|nr:unnamed protein product [Acanthoscelides obtectus]CAK1665602.1 hypothetical protein AOBTE_LOCUS24894 [Acanthoscelides obtectus]
MPIVRTFQFDYYHLYSIPTFHKRLFKFFIPSGKYLVKNELYFVFAGHACTETVAKQYVCKELDLRRIKESNPCEVQLLKQKTPTTCREVEAVITEPVMKKLHDFGQSTNHHYIKLSRNSQSFGILSRNSSRLYTGTKSRPDRQSRALYIDFKSANYFSKYRYQYLLPSRMTSAFIWTK